MKPGTESPKTRAAGGYIAREPGSLKQATDALITACGGGISAAKLARVSQSSLQRYAAPEDMAAYIPADVIRALELHCGDPIVTRFLAAEQGCALLAVKYDPTPAVLAADMGDLADDIARLTKDVVAALAHGAPEKDAARLKADIDQALAVLFHMRSRLNAGPQT